MGARGIRGIFEKGTVASFKCFLTVIHVFGFIAHTEFLFKKTLISFFSDKSY